MRGLAAFALVALLAGCGQGREVLPEAESPVSAPVSDTVDDTPDDDADAPPPSKIPVAPGGPPSFLDPVKVLPAPAGGWRTSAEADVPACLAGVDLRGERFDRGYVSQTHRAAEIVVRTGSATEAERLYAEAVRAVEGCADVRVQDLGFVDVGAETRDFAVVGEQPARYAIFRLNDTFAVFTMTWPRRVEAGDLFATTAARALDLLR